MRSYPFVRRTLPCMAVLLAMAVLPIPVHAGIVEKLMATASKVLTPKNNQQDFSIEKHFIGEVINEAKTAGGYSSNNLRNGSSARAEKVALVQTETHTEIIPEYTEKGLTFLFRYDETALKNPHLLVKDLALISMITTKTKIFGNNSSIFEGFINPTIWRQVESPHAIAELLTNVHQGSPTARARWNALQSRLIHAVSIKPFYIEKMNLSSNVIQDIQASLDSQTEKLDIEAVQFSRKQQKSLDKWKSETKTLDQLEDLKLKLDDLILNNDRSSVRRLLEAYLPWAVMEPAEANAWKIWLEAIEHPNFEKTTVAFRGVDYGTDKIQRRQTSQGEIYGFMSTVLTKNQGNYTRRLRSLSTNREKNGDDGFENFKSNVMSVKVTDQMTNHSINPRASSFLSFTYAPHIARSFMHSDIVKNVNGKKVLVPYGGLLVVKMDSRRLVPNLTSIYATEIELLAPLIVFPDEVVAFKEGAFTEKYTYDMFIEDVSKKTGIDFSSWAEATDANNESLKSRYNREGYQFLKQMLDIKHDVLNCSKVF